MNFEFYFMMFGLCVTFTLSFFLAQWGVLKFYYVLKRAYLNRKMLREQKRAARGFVTCRYQNCDVVATYVTPNGYYCDWHWEPMSKRRFSHGGYVTWAHKLEHAVRRY